MKLNKSNSTNCLKISTNDVNNKSDFLKMEHNSTDGGCHYLLSSSHDSNDITNSTFNSYCSSSITTTKSNYSSTSSSSSLSTNECIIDRLNKFNLNETVNETTEIKLDSAEATTTAQPVQNSINPIKLNTLYKIQEKIRSGGFGDVFKGVRRFDNLPIAIKIIRKEKINQWSVNVSLKLFF